MSVKDTQKEIDLKTLKIPGLAPPLKVVNDSNLQISNKKFIATVFHDIPKNASPLICTILGDHQTCGWIVEQLVDATEQFPNNHNSNINSSSFYFNKYGKVKACNRSTQCNGGGHE